MIDSLVLLYVTLVAMVDGLGLGDEEELDYGDGAASGHDGAAGDDVVAGSGLASLSESELLAGEESTAHISFCDPPAVSTPEPEPMETLPQQTETRKPVHYLTSWAYCDLRIQEILSRIDGLLRSRGVSKCPFCGTSSSDMYAHASQHFFAWFCCEDGFSHTSRDTTRRHMRDRHGDSVATMASVSRAGYSKYCTENPTNDGICFPKLLPMTDGVSLEEVLTSLDLGSWNLVYFFRVKKLGQYQKNVVETDEAFYARVSGVDVRKLSSVSADRYSKIKAHKLGKQANREKSKGLASQNFEPKSKSSRVSAPVSKTVNRRNSKGSKVQKGRLELTLDQNKKVVGIQSSTTSNASSTARPSRVGTPRASSGSAEGARAFVPDVGDTTEGGPSLLAELAQCEADMERSRELERIELRKLNQFLGQITSSVNLCQQSIARREVHSERIDELAKRKKGILDQLLQRKE